MKITYEQVKVSLERLASERPDYVYMEAPNDYRYFNVDGTPSCIVGYVLAEHGVAAMDYADKLNRVGIYRAVEEMDLDMDLRTVRMLSKVQASQDDGVSWGDVVESVLGGTND